jgi:hypothetical protein
VKKERPFFYKNHFAKRKGKEKKKTSISESDSIYSAVLYENDDVQDFLLEYLLLSLIRLPLVEYVNIR